MCSLSFYRLPSTTTFKTIHHQYNLHSIYEKFTPRVCTALLGFHAVTGSDQTGKFNGFTKKTYWDTFIQSTDDILVAFIHLGTTDMNHNTDFKSLESFVVHLYSRNKVPPGVANSPELRWYYFSKNQSESQKMPSPLVHFIKRLFEHTIHLYNGSQLISLLHSCLIQMIMDENWINNIRCMMLS